jgi:polysaccharide biosynthesis protein PslH
MRVLQICHRVPYPPSDGGSIAMHQITEGLLSQGISVKVLALSPISMEASISLIDNDYIQKTGFESVSIDTRVKYVPALLNLFSGKSYNIARFCSKEMEDVLGRTLKREHFDIIQLEGLYLTPYIPLIRSLSRAPLLYRSHNIEHFIWLRLARAARHPFKKFYLQLLGNRLRKYENKVIHQVDGLVAISDIDKQFFLKQGFSGPSTVIPAGIPQIIRPDKVPIKEYNSVFHLGSMDWRPNQEGIVWFLKRVWPLVVNKRPELRFYLAGKRMPLSFHQYANENVMVVGEVEDALQFLLSKNVMVVPLLSGGGMRVKIIEGMAISKTIVSTTIGAEGIGCLHGEHLYLSDRPEDMARWIIHCIDKPEEAEMIGIQAKEFAEQHYAMERIIKNLIKFYSGFYSN